MELDVKTAQTFQVKCDDVFVSRSNTRDLVGLSAIADADPQDIIVFPDLLIRLSFDRPQVVIPQLSEGELPAKLRLE